jgi:AmmeMemoRadiSam system protein B
LDIRQPSAANKFYPAEPIVLEELIKNCFKHPIGPGKLPLKELSSTKILGALVPHAGYQYSGPVAANSYYEFSNTNKPELVVIIGPNHWGIGDPVSIFSNGIWMTPLGKIEADTEAAELFAKLSTKCKINNFAHSQDHCIEVQLPFLQFIYRKEFKILPILLNSQDESTSIEISKNLVRLSEQKDILLLASDLTHYEPHEDAKRKDHE